GRLEPRLRDRSRAHYAHAARETSGADPVVYRARADRQVALVLDFYPRYLGIAAGQFLTLAALAMLWHRGKLGTRTVRIALLGLSLGDLVGFGFGLNPAIPPRDDRLSGPLIDYLRREAGPPARIVGVGEELPPNALMRYGLSDVRNYDSVELSRSLA